MGFTVDAKHVLLCSLVALLLTYASFHDKFPHGDAVSVQGRKGLIDPQLTPSFDATEDVNVEAEETSTQEVAQTEENREFSALEASPEEELPAAREMAETEPGTGTQVTTPDPEYNANPFLQQIKQNNIEAAKEEDAIQTCILIDGCGTPP